MSSLLHRYPTYLAFLSFLLCFFSCRGWVLADSTFGPPPPPRTPPGAPSARQTSAWSMNLDEPRCAPSWCCVDVKVHCCMVLRLQPALVMSVPPSTAASVCRRSPCLPGKLGRSLESYNNQICLLYRSRYGMVSLREIGPSCLSAHTTELVFPFVFPSPPMTIIYYFTHTMSAQLLSQERNARGLPREMAASYLRDAASAVDHLHSVEIMHRDVKVGP